MDITAIRTPGLGDTTYLLVHDGAGIIVDPQRDTDRFLEAAEAAGAQIQYILETHLHNDYISGGREVASRSRGQLVLPAAAGVAFDHVPAFHLEDIEMDGGLRIRPLHTPGHTPEHVSYLVLLDRQPVALFSGGSLLTGSAGRTDLLGAPRARQLATLQFGSLQRLTSLPDAVALYPTHGAGSFCSAASAGKSSSTIGYEKAHNPALLHADAAAFATAQLAGLQPYPRYYVSMGAINMLGPTPIPERPIPELAPNDLLTMADAVEIVDARPREKFAAGHISGSIGIELDNQFAVWVGWVLPFNSPLVLVLEPNQDLAEVAVQLARIGLDDIRGVVRGLDGWNRADQPLATYRTVEQEQFAAAIRNRVAHQLLDVRAPGEWTEGHIQGAVHRYVPDLTSGVPEEFSQDEPVWVACASGYRATIAAGMIERAGFCPIVLARGGVPDVLDLLARTTA